MKKKERIAIIGIIFVNIMWGLSFIGSKSAMAAGLQPFSLVTLRFLTASVVLFPLTAALGEKPKISPRDVPGLFLSALFGMTIYFYFELNGLKKTSAATAALIIALIPIFTMITELVLYRKKPAWIQWIGALVSLIGVYIVVNDTDGGTTITGVLLMLGACACWVIYGEITARLLKRLPTMTVTCWQSLFSLISLIPLCFTENVPWKDLGSGAWLWSCLFLGLICSAICYILYNHSIAELSPGRTAIFLNVNPIAAAVGSVLILGEPLSPRLIIGGVIVLVSLFLVNKFKPEEKRNV